jgi:7-cyano-7-deazaguanine synthase in queuosine biosynthesis
MKIIVEQNAKEEVHELTNLNIRCQDIMRTFILDVDFSQVLNMSWNIHTAGLDFLILCACVYAIDKIVPRSSMPDLWTRDLRICIPVRDTERWRAASEALGESISFLTGDRWSFEFTQAEYDFASRRRNRRKRARGFPKSPVVSLLSGGLDSFIAAINLLNEHRDSRILFVSHYDGHVSGPASDQDSVRRFLSAKYLNRVSHLQVRTGVNVEDDGEGKYKFETSFRGRSLIFLGLAVYAALKIGTDVPIIVPENGPISLNMPLNPSRRGACSTRTVHPFFISSMAQVLSSVGITNPISNPYVLKTKGEMVKECAAPSLLAEAYTMTNSCGKAGRKTHWQNRTARACGACVPCLLRRAALHVASLDNETFGNDAFTGDPSNFADLHALLGLIRENPTESQIQKKLIANGRLKMDELADFAQVVRRMLDEVAAWLAAKGSPKARSLSGVSESR